MPKFTGSGPALRQSWGVTKVCPDFRLRNVPLRYISTRGAAPALGFNDVLLAGLARDGGLYVPETWPRLTADEIRALRGLSYEETAFRIMQPFVGGEIADADLQAMIDARLWHLPPPGGRAAEAARRRISG